MGKSIDLDKLRSINFGGRHARDSRARVTRSEQGRITTIQIDHPDGSVEGVARPAPVRASLNMEGPSHDG